MLTWTSKFVYTFITSIGMELIRANGHVLILDAFLGSHEM